MTSLIENLRRIFSIRLFRKDTHITIAEMERIFTGIAETTYPRTWREDHISMTLMEKLQFFFNKQRVNFPGWSKIVDWQSFKNSGSQETNNGDIAILVNIQFSDGAVLKGVACLEAKRTFPSGNFDQLDQAQVNRIYGNLPHSQMLLYTHDNQKIPIKFPNTKKWNSHMWVTSMNTTKQLLPQIARGNGRLLRTSFPLSMFLMSRIFWGQDLHYNEALYNDILRGVDRISEFNPTFLGVVNIYYDGQQPLNVLVSDAWERIGRPRPNAV